MHSVRNVHPVKKHRVKKDFDAPDFDVDVNLSVEPAIAENLLDNFRMDVVDDFDATAGADMVIEEGGDIFVRYFFKDIFDEHVSILFYM